MIVFLNGEFVAEEDAVVSVFDRSFLYGDGLFETLLVHNAKLFRWNQHFERLCRGADSLKIKLPLRSHEFVRSAEQLIFLNHMPHAILRLTLSRGTGPRGYSPKGADHPVLVMALHPAPPLEPHPPAQWRLVTSSVRLLADDPLAQFKTCNKLPQIVARAEAEAAGANEALLLNTKGFIVEAASSNLFWVQNGTLYTPPLASGVLPGVTRAIVTEICQKAKIPVQEENITPDKLLQVQGAFLSLSSSGIIEAVTLNNQPLRQSPLTHQIRASYHALVVAESSPPHF